ncbi:MAG TPA: calcium-binding protein [Actinobacteria bacterium]|nr:calcium-binding protein [Actinomycetota bacterium]
MILTAEFSAISHERGSLSESIRWIPGPRAFQWVDILGGTLTRWYADTGLLEQRRLGAPLGCAMPIDDDRSVLAREKDLAVYDWARDSIAPLATLPVAPGTRLNDGGLCPDGSVWVGSMSEQSLPGRGRLWRVTVDGSVETVVSQATISNGLAWIDADRAVYIDTPTGRVDLIFGDGVGGWIREPFAEVPGPGWPDGLHVDSGGDVWVALWDGGRVLRFSPHGMVIEEVLVPAPRCTSVARGGAHGELLAVTTATWGMDDSELDMYPLSGHVLVRTIRDP